MVAYMDPAKKLIVELSRNIELDGTPLNVLTDFSPENEIPCLTMNEEPGLGLVETNTLIEKTGPESFQKVRIDRYKKAIGTHAWSQESSEERDYIIAELERVVREAKLAFYNYCANYDVETHLCSTTSQPCDTHTGAVNNTPTLEGRCPYPDVKDDQSPRYRNPRSWFTVLGIDAEKFMPRGDNVADELEIIPEIYHKYVIWDYELVIRTAVTTGTYQGISASDDEILD